MGISIPMQSPSGRKVFEPGEIKERHLENELQTGKGANVPIISDRRMEFGNQKRMKPLQEFTQAQLKPSHSEFIL